MYRFKEKSKPLDLPELDLRLVDILTLKDSEYGRIVYEFNKEFGAFVKSDLTDVKICDNNSHLEKLFTAYLDASQVLKDNNQPVPLLEDWSRKNSHLWMEDWASAPHEGVFRYELRTISSDLPIGAVVIAQINKTNETQTQLTLSGHVMITLPDHPTLSYGQYWGTIMKELLDKPFISLEDENRSWVFDEFIFPTGPKARYVEHSRSAVLEEVAQTAGSEILVEREDATKEFAPRNVRKTKRVV